VIQLQTAVLAQTFFLLGLPQHQLVLVVFTQVVVAVE
jgi:hypothetical protein